MLCPQIADGGMASKMEVNADLLNKLLQTADKWWSSNVGVRRGTNNSSLYKTGLVMKQIHVPWAWPGPLVRPKQWKRDMRFGT
jgi:hypothetical protein